jgi:hypothetical protein
MVIFMKVRFFHIENLIDKIIQEKYFFILTKWIHFWIKFVQQIMIFTIYL